MLKKVGVPIQMFLNFLRNNNYVSNTISKTDIKRKILPTRGTVISVKVVRNVDLLTISIYIENAWLNNIVFTILKSHETLLMFVYIYISVVFISRKKDIVLVDSLKLLPQVIYLPQMQIWFIGVGRFRRSHNKVTTFHQGKKSCFFQHFDFHFSQCLVKH